MLLGPDAKQVQLTEPIEYKRNGDLVLTTPGRVIFNEDIIRALATAIGEGFDPAGQPFMNRTLGKKETNDFISELVDRYGALALASVLDAIKELGFHYATYAGLRSRRTTSSSPRTRKRFSPSTRAGSKRSRISTKAA